MTQQEKLDVLNKEWGRKKMSLGQMATNAVPGEGNPNAEVLFIGEAPGKAEDEQGKPFVGAAGKFLTELSLSFILIRLSTPIRIFLITMFAASKA